MSKTRGYVTSESPLALRLFKNGRPVSVVSARAFLVKTYPDIPVAEWDVYVRGHHTVAVRKTEDKK